jgi:hypothetical protein
MTKRKRQVYAIIRIDLFNNNARLEDVVTVKEIVSSLDAAQAEVLRLNSLNGPKRARYFWQTTRLILDDGQDHAT